MKLRHLETDGFRSLKLVFWQPGDLNIIIGPNGTGKSNLLRLLKLISMSAQGRLRRHILDLGGMDALVWDGQADSIGFKILSSNSNYIGTEWDIVGTDDEITYQFSIDRLRDSATPLVMYESLDISGFPNKIIDRGPANASVFDREGKVVLKAYSKSIMRRDEILVEMQPDESFLSETAISLVGGEEITRVRKFIESWLIYHDIRVDQDAAIRQAIVTRPEIQLDEDGQNLIAVLHTLYTSNRDFRREIDLGMKAAFGQDYEELLFPPAADQRTQMRLQWRSQKRSVSAADLSDGTLRFLFLLTVLANPSLPPLIAIDEPETGLHPRMLPIIAEYAVEAARRTQVIFTTHSDQFLSAFRETQPTTTVAKWENGETTLSVLDEEQLKYWLKEYTLGELFSSGQLENLA